MDLDLDEPHVYSNSPPLSNSPAGTPRIVQPDSPVHSIHLGIDMESIHDQPDHGMRTTDFFDDTTDDEASTKAHGSIPRADDEFGQPSSPKSTSSYLGGNSADNFATRCGDSESSDKKRASIPAPEISDSDRFLLLPQSPTSQAPARPARPQSELTHFPATYDHEENTPTTTQARPVSITRQLSTQLIDNTTQSSTAAEAPTSGVDHAASTAAIEAAKDELIMNAHTQTLQALLRDDAALQQSAATRISFMPDPARPASQTPGQKKRVSLAPPPINVQHGSLPDDIVRTPYPMVFRKNYVKPSPLRTSMKLEHETILPLSIRNSYSHRPRRVAHMTLPANPDAAEGGVNMTDASPSTKEKHFEALDFDDASFFTELRRSYRALAGLYRFLSARSLHSIRLNHSSSCARSSDCDLWQPATCSHTFPQSPRLLESKGLTDSFSEAELMRHFRNPALGKSRYAWVHWAKRLANRPDHMGVPAPDPPADSPAARMAEAREDREIRLLHAGEERGFPSYADCAASLEFVEGWSAWRIFLALAVVKILALAAAICWILLGIKLSRFETGYRSAGERVAGGAMLGTFVLLTGWTSVAAWLGLSWIID